ncbi:CASP-like protein 1C1 [Tasmannia lanceolata]|uniref:CASP-like protein 1C1 n=1 Tax=Tasmannia lanceolata TaxID=3420 RepID=UPI00406462AD
MAKTKKLCTFLLRFLAMATTLSATIVMVTSHEHTTFFNISINAKYHYTPAFKYFVAANAIGSVYSLLVIFLPETSMLWRLVVALDVIITMLLTSSISAAGAIAILGKKGNSHAGWLPICGQIHKFCRHVTVAMILGFSSVLIYMLILLYAIHTVLNPLLL